MDQGCRWLEYSSVDAGGKGSSTGNAARNYGSGKDKAETIGISLEGGRRRLSSVRLVGVDGWRREGRGGFF